MDGMWLLGECAQELLVLLEHLLLSLLLQGQRITWDLGRILQLRILFIEPLKSQVEVGIRHVPFSFNL